MGGAISTPNNATNANNLTIKDSYFESNHVSSTGGAIVYIAKDLIVDSCVFDSNYVKLVDGGYGGGVCQIGWEFIDSNCKFLNCQFINNNVIPSNNTRGHAGVACLRRGVSFIDCNFMGNYAYDGGVLGFHDSGNVIRCNFTNNSAIRGGAILNDGDSNQIINIENSYFDSNNADNGGVLYLSCGCVNISGCNFFKNNASNGGVLFVSKIELNINDCLFRNNSAKYGGSIYILDASRLCVNNSYFYNNTGLNGSAIYNNGFLSIFNSVFRDNKAISNIHVNSKSFVNCSDNAVIRVICEGGNNIANAIWSKNRVNINGMNVHPNNKLSSQLITLNIGGKFFTLKTDKNGIVFFKFNTKNYKIKTYQGIVSFRESNDYYGSSKQFNLKITTKKVYKTKLKNIKKLKKVKKYQVYAPSPRYINVKYERCYFQTFENSNLKLLKKNITGFKKIKNLVYKWKNASKKSIKSKYKWYKSKYCHVTKYMATKIIYKYVNGKFIKKSVNKKYKYSKKSKFKNKRTKDWSKFVLPSVDCESDNKKIIKLSKKIIKSEAKQLKRPISKLSDTQKANAILHWVQKHIIYDDYGDTRYGAVKTLKYKMGNCADQTHLSIALLRSSNIPAKYEAKIVKLNKKNVGHAWHLAYLKNKWLPGESTSYYHCPNYGKSNDLYKYYIKRNAVDNLHKISYKFISKYVDYNYSWLQISEKHLINNKWEIYYGNNWNGEFLSKLHYDIRGGLNEL